MRKPINLLLALLLSPLFICGQNTSSVYLDAGDHISISSQLDSNSTAFTIHFWAKASDLDNDGTYISDWSATGTQDQQFKFHKSNDNIYVYSAGISPNWVGYNMASGYDTLWYHIAYTTDVTDSNRLYINGLEVDKKPSNGFVSQGSGFMSIGAEVGAAAPTDHYLGNMDELGVWDYALTESEINQYMNCPPVGTETGLLGYWKMNTNSGTTLVDLTANANDGVFTGTPSWSSDTQAYSCPTGLNEVSETELVLYPNPSKGLINLFSDIRINQIQVMTIEGKVIQNLGSVDQINIDNSGVYLIKVNTDSGTIVKQVVISK